MKRIVTFLVVILTSQLYSQTITFNGCNYLLENQNYIFNLGAVDGTGRNTYSTTPIDGAQHCGGIGTCEFRIIWSVANSRWEFMADSGNGGFSATNTLYYNTSASVPNPPSLTLGNWIENIPTTNSLCGGNLTSGNSTLTGNVQNVLAVNGFSANSGIVLYPNPAGNELNIAAASVIKSISVWNLQGQKIFASESNLNVIDISNYQTGFYLVRLQTDDGMKVGNFLKK